MFYARLFVTLWQKLRHSDMERLTLTIDVPAGVLLDMELLKNKANEYVQRYIYMLNSGDGDMEVDNKKISSFRKLRGVMSSDKSYREMVEEALKDKYML